MTRGINRFKGLNMMLTEVNEKYAPGDQDAAAQNGVYYYPILVRHEGESWKELRKTGFSKLQSGDYAGYEAEKIAAFLKNLDA